VKRVEDGRIRVFLLVVACLAGVGEAAFLVRPYLQNLTDTTVAVLWESSTPQTGGVAYGLTPEYGSQVMEPNPVTMHELVLPGLAPDTGFHYCAFSSTDTSPDAVFRTAAAENRAFSFIAYGDDRSDSAAHQSVVNRMALVSPVPGLLFNGGDLTATGAAGVYRTFFNIERSMLDHIPMFPSMGNHDKSNVANWLAMFALPNNERWYSVRYGNSAFHCLDVYSTFTPGSAQYDWLLSELMADSADPAIHHIFVFCHEPPYTTNSGHASNMNVRTYVCPLFERFKVAIAFSGHNHAYEHSFVNDVHYIMTGGGGAPLYSSWDAAQPWTVYREATYEFTLISVSGDSIWCKGIRPDGSVFDSFALVSLSSVGEDRGGEAGELTPGLSVLEDPFVENAAIRFRLPVAAEVRLSIFDANGARLKTLVNGMMGRGAHQVSWDAGPAPDGHYFCVLRTGSTNMAIRLTRAR
jgi:acid phosphatase type 7